MSFQETLRGPRTRKIAGAVAAALALWAVAGFFVLPRILRSVLERKLAESLHRPVTLRGLSINPFALSAELRGLDVKERGGAGPFFSFDSLYVNLEAMSLLRGGPVIRAVTLTKPSVAVVRRPDGTYNFQDLLEPSPRPATATEPLHFSVNNIRIEGGSLDFDDRPNHTKHTVRDLTIGIPFLSNIPSKVEITTQPVFQAKINGAPFSLNGKTKPFAHSHESALDLELSDVDVPFYLSYVAAALPTKIVSARLDAKIRITFSQPREGKPALLLSGTAALRKVALDYLGEHLIAGDRLQVVLDSFDVFGKRARVRSVDLDGPEVWIRRDRVKGYNVARAFEREGPSRVAASPAKATSEPATDVRIAEVGLRGGKIHYDDLALAKPFHTLLSDIAITVKNYATAPKTPVGLVFSAKSDAGETLGNTGSFSAGPFVIEGALELGHVPLKRYAPFFDDAVLFTIDDGVLDLAGKYRFASGQDGTATLSGLTATLASPRLRRKGEKKPFFQAPSVKLAGAGFDLARRDLAVGELSSVGGTLSVARDKDGNADITNLTVPSPAGPAAGTKPDPPGSPSRPPSWRISLARLALDRYTIRIEDHATGRPAAYALTNTTLSLENVSTDRGKRGTLALRFGVDGRGVASARGPVGIQPTYAKLDADVRKLDLVPLEAYVLSSFNVRLARATLTAKGILAFREGDDGKTSVGYEGRAEIDDLLTVEPATGVDFFKWQAFSLQGLKAGFNPTFVETREMTVNGVACDVVIEADGTVNLARVVGTPPPGTGTTPRDDAAEPIPDAAPAVSPTPAAPAPASAPTPAAPAASGVAPAPTSEDKVPIRIDTLVVSNGRIGLADHFVKPNYAATLGDLSGRVTGLSTREGSVAQLDLSGRLANRSPLKIQGRVNPLAATAFADVTATFRDIDLPPFTPYFGKYAGYAIGRGTLAMEVAYKLQNRKLEAQNKFVIDQFELGDKVESKDATKLPVKLAISLLRDRNGVIDIDLPIEGSLDDPKFRLGKVILHVLGNLIGKAATAPFALLGKAFGGKGEELSSIEFADGRDTLEDAAKKKLDAIAKALNDRPALKLEAAGRFSEEKDPDGLRRARLERKVKAQKLADLAGRGEAPASVDAVVVEEAEYPKYLERAYKKEKFKKPRNGIGIAKSLPPAEMESLILQNLTVTADDLRQLALARANAAKLYLTGPGGVDAARVFVLEPGAPPASGDAGGKSSASRVDFSLK